ncbi:type IV pilus assembly protein FimV [Kushneria indalinina]|uniref:FimV N-terminal domain-containing protein n=1 Tax=Kushneria indalinina DSM 14324 TaxID=1122140 RepID=A0A3D9DYX5_9GAMM|nr:hypothetical protein [Kushneria indalinina]REC95963.1 hypothetical protein C8D72_0632 [Kushneria indalinina DSM 14324]
MADRPCRLRLRSCLLSALLLSGSMTAHAVGLAEPQVMSGFNEPLKARVALLDTGNLRADDVRVALADSERWQAMNLARSADTDTLRLAVNGRPGHLYLEVQGSRPLAAPWLDVVLTLNWPQGELTPQLTLLPSTGPGSGAEAAGANASSAAQGARHGAAVASDARDQSGARQTHETPASAPDNSRIAALEGRLDRLEQQLRASREAQAALMSDLESVRTQSLAHQDSFDTAEMASLTSRQQALETRLDRLDQEVLTAGVSAPESISPEDAPQQDASPGEAAVAPAIESLVPERDRSFVWTWALAAFLLMLAGVWAGVRRWRQQRYRLVSAAELSPMAGADAHSASAASSGGQEGDAREIGIVGAEEDEVSRAHRAQVEAICSEAEVFQRHNRRDHAITMLKEGLEHYPNDFQLIRALAALEATPDNDEPRDGRDDDRRHPAASTSTSTFDETPALAPAWSLQTFPEQEEVIEPGYGTAYGTHTKSADVAMTPSAGFPHDWALEEVAFEGVDTDNERPDAGRSHRHA